MTDDLEAMGVESPCFSRDVIESEHASIAREYARLLRDYVEHQYTIFSPGRCVISPDLPDPLPGTVDDAHLGTLQVLLSPPASPLLSNRLHTYCSSFLAEVYRRSPDRVITYDLPFPIPLFGDYLGATKVIVNRATIARQFGFYGNACVNDGHFDDCSTTHGLFVNRGTIDYYRHSRSGRRSTRAFRHGTPLDGSYACHGMHVDVSGRFVRGFIPHEYANKSTSLANGHMYTLRLQDDLVLSGHSLGNRNRLSVFPLSLSTKQDPVAALTAWFDGLASATPEDLFRRYCASDEKPEHIATRELFGLLFHKPLGHRPSFLRRWLP